MLKSEVKTVSDYRRFEAEYIQSLNLTRVPIDDSLKELRNPSGYIYTEWVDAINDFRSQNIELIKEVNAKYNSLKQSNDKAEQIEDKRNVFYKVINKLWLSIKRNLLKLKLYNL